MIDVSPSDLFEVRKESLFSNLDEDYLFDLYLPLVGVKAVGFYLALFHMQEDISHSHEEFLTQCQSSVGEFSAAMPSLEALGLVATYLKKEEKYNYLVYCLYAPKTPKEFFSNILLIGTLRHYLDKVQIKAITDKYAVLPPPEGFEDVSSPFRDYFSLDIDDKSIPVEASSIKGHGSAAIKTGFDKNGFLRSLMADDPRFGTKSFSKEEMVKIARVAALYSYSESAMADFILDCYTFAKPYGERVDFYLLEKKAQENIKYTHLHSLGGSQENLSIKGDSSLSVILRSMDKLTPEQFLRKLQKDNKPATADLKLVNDLVVEMGLPQGPCNALILFMIVRNGGILSRPYMEKIAAGMVRNGLTNALDAMNYLTSTAKKKQKSDDAKSNGTAPKEEAHVSVSSPDEKVSDSEFQDLMNDLYTPEKK
ncbi:MAG: hypothetical protein LKF75_01785 [Bacilli bacterium]|jgi:replication initiation and membrane attachment protein|nr:hypothetical protein [Bacilli bacterium]MCH4210242.1 hypothetical protein [Bacilli bacterium]MCH4228424.1 hypothetical protein [Bacilli bacterium]MCH4278024.1 hypothetical protein [Bacilli bacterium]MCI2055152.1 hypothetical protein [Bacilli bacterium]